MYVLYMWSGPVYVYQSEKEILSKQVIIAMENHIFQNRVRKL